jgi:hypothetical protein
MRSWLAVLALVAACQGTEGTLVVLRGDGGTGGVSGAAGAAGTGGTMSMAEKPYVPPADVSWDARLDDAVDIGEPVDLFYLDAELQPENDLAALQADGRHYLCYLSAGTFEDFRDDADQFPQSVLGNDAPFRGERWLDVRAPEVRAIMAKRVELLAAKGCDGVPPSSLAVDTADTGFPLTQGDVLDYARWLAERIHGAGMSAGLSARAELTAELWPSFDFALAIDCMAQSQCSEYAVFQTARKPVLHVEFGDESSAPNVCSAAEQLGFVPLVTTQSFSGQSVRCQDIL